MGKRQAALYKTIPNKSSIVILHLTGNTGAQTCTLHNLPPAYLIVSLGGNTIIYISFITIMATFILPHFGPLDPEDLDEYYDTEIALGSKPVEIDLNFEAKIIDPRRLETVQHFIDNIRIFDINNKGHIAKDYANQNGDTVKFYIAHHLEELGAPELATLLPRGSKAAEHEKLLLQQLHLVRVGIYPDSASQFAVFDYSIGKDITNDLVVLFTDENGNLDYMTMES